MRRSGQRLRCRHERARRRDLVRLHLTVLPARPADGRVAAAPVRRQRRAGVPARPASARPRCTAAGRVRARVPAADGVTPDERRRLQALVQELWQLEGPFVGSHVGDLAWGPTHRAGEDPWRVRIWDEGAGAWMRRPHELEYELLPELRSGPLEHELLDWAESE